MSYYLRYRSYHDPLQDALANPHYFDQSTRVLDQALEEAREIALVTYANLYNSLRNPITPEQYQHYLRRIVIASRLPAASVLSPHELDEAEVIAELSGEPE